VGAVNVERALRLVRQSDDDPGDSLVDDPLFDPSDFHPELPDYPAQFDPDNFDDGVDDDDPEPWDDDPDDDDDPEADRADVDSFDPNDCPDCPRGECPYLSDDYQGN
jgi:hypothetical protein